MDLVAAIAGLELDASGTPQGLESISSGIKEAYSRKRRTNNTKTDVVVLIRRIVVVTIGRTTVVRVVVPRTTTYQPEVSSPSLMPQQD